MASSGMPFADARRERWRCFGGALLVAWLIAVEPAFCRDPNEVDQWHQNLIRERQVEVRLRTALRDLDEDRLVAGLNGLQSIIDRDDDVFLRFETQPVPCGAHALASRILGALPAQALATYETLYGKEAAQLLEAARSGANPDLLAGVVRRFYFTEAGFAAGNHLAAYWTDHGCNELAWSWWQRVLDEPAHSRRIRAIDRVQGAWCCQRLGNTNRACELLEPLGDEQTVTVAGRKVSIGRLRTLLSQPANRTAANAGSQFASLNEDGHVSGSGSLPVLSRPLWRTTLAGEQSRHIETLAQAWESFQLLNGLPIGTSQAPLVVGDRLVYRDYEGLRAIDVSSGKLLWHYPCASSLAREISTRQAVPGEGNPDPHNVMRHVVGNSTLGALASDGNFVFAIDRIEGDVAPAATPAPSGTDASPPSQRQSNELAAFDLAGAASEIKPRWIAGGRKTESGEARILAGHYFLGPPLPVGDRLFAVSEYNEVLYLSCIRSESGNLVWSQVVCSVPQPIAVDQQRVALVCTPVYGGGIVVCPTQAGVLVAVDSLSGKLLWAASHDDGEPQQRQHITAWPYAARRRIGHAGYVNLPVIRGTSIVYLPAHSDHLSCLDLASGQTRWRVRREDLEASTATEYVAAVSDESVVVVGRRKCRGLALETGSEKWTVRLGSSPTGRGVCLGENYFVPLDDGRVICLAVESGRATAAPTTPGALRLGNLAAGRDLIVSMGTREIAVYPQARNVLEHLETELAKAPLQAPRLLEVAELDLTVGRFDRAEKTLEEVLRLAAGAPEAARAADLLRELLSSRVALAGRPVDCRQTEAALERLAHLSTTPEQRGRYLLERFRESYKRGDMPSALVAARELAAIDLGSLLEAAGDPSRKAAPQVLAAGLFGRTDQVQMAPFRAFEMQIVADLPEALAAPDAAIARRLIRLCGEMATADDPRLPLAAQLADRGRFQEAELVLLSCRESRQATTAGQATRMLAELWNRQGLYHDAALLLAEIGEQFAEIQVAPHHRGTTWLAAYPRENPAFEAYRRLTPPLWSGDGVTIVENRTVSDELQAVYNGDGMQLVPTPRHSPFDVLDNGRGAEGIFSIVDRHTGRRYPETIHIPGRYFNPIGAQSGYLHHSHVGHFVPMGGVGVLYGVSLLERKLLWKTAPREIAGFKEVVRVGPAGPGFCTFQHRQHLYVVDPVDGRILWQRDDLEAASGLMSEPFLGIIGDDKVLVVFSGNGANYTVYETANGAELRRGRLDVQTSMRMPRRAIGRRLFHFTTAADARRMRVWDALSDRFVLDEPADQIAESSAIEGIAPGTKVFTFVHDREEAAFVTTTGRIRVVDIVTGQQQFEAAVQSELLEDVSFVRAFRDRDKYFFNLQRSWLPGKAPAIAGYLVNDSSLPCVHVEGGLCAFDIKTRQMLWHQSLGKRSLLHQPHLPLPVLVSLCRIRKQDQSSLAVEVLDVRTGKSLASRDDLLSDRLLQTSYDRHGGVIELRGAKTAIRLEFPTNVARLEAGEPPR